MESVSWNAEMGQWNDYWLSNSKCKSIGYLGSSNITRKYLLPTSFPCGLSHFTQVKVEFFTPFKYEDASLVDKVMGSLQSSSLPCACGVATSLTNSREQWDFPNGWAPIQHMIIEGLARSGLKEARSMAEDIAARWIKTNYVAYRRTGTMHEKHNVENCGDFGGGGEYMPQTGFGWSNGVVLALLEELGWPEDRRIGC